MPTVRGVQGREISGDEGCRYLRNVFALRYIPRDDPVIIMNVVVVAVVSVGYPVVGFDIGFARIRTSGQNDRVSISSIYQLHSFDIKLIFQNQGAKL